MMKRSRENDVEPDARRCDAGTEMYVVVKEGVDDKLAA